MASHQALDGDSSERIMAPRSAFRQDHAAIMQALRQPLSPKDLAPLVIPKQPNCLPQLARKISITRLKSSSTSQDPTCLAPKGDDSPRSRALFTPFTPMSGSGSTVTPRSATTALTASTLATPVSAPADNGVSPHPWEKPGLYNTDTASHHTATDATSIPKADPRYTTRSPSLLSQSHQRGNSDSASIMERGRPRRRHDGSAVGASHNRSASKRSISYDRHAFETLPQGWKSGEATEKLDQTEVAYLRRQAIGQALRFEVLKREDVEELSKASISINQLFRSPF